MKSPETVNLERLNTAKFLKSGDRAAFQWLYLKHLPSFKHYGYQLTPSWDVDDLIQLTCLQLLQYDGTHKDPNHFNFKNYFCTSMHNTMINLTRNRKMLKLTELPENLDLKYEPYAEPDYSVLLNFISGALTYRQGKAMLLRFKGHSYKSIGRILGAPHGAVAGLIYNGSKVLREFENEILDL